MISIYEDNAILLKCIDNILLIARITGISRQSINKYLQGAKAPKVSTMRKIAEALGIDI